MENASKALMMAASVLIGIMIISLAVYLFTTFGASSKQLHEEIETNRLNEFNTQFTLYENKNDTTIYDIISVANLAKENNSYYGLSASTPDNFYVTVKIDNESVERKNKDALDRLIKEEEMIDVTDKDNTRYKTLPTYNCGVTINEITKRVSEVRFTKKEN